jgi:hypothetical protein
LPLPLPLAFRPPKPSNSLLNLLRNTQQNTHHSLLLLLLLLLLLPSKPGPRPRAKTNPSSNP